MRTVNYYISVWRAIMRKSLSKSIAYRFELLSRIVRMVMLVGLQLILVQSLYAGTNQIAGWRVEEYYLLIGIYNAVNSLSWGIFNVNLWRLEEKVLKGQFDFYLLYPTNSVFSAAFIEFFPDDAIGAIAGFILIAYYFILNLSSITFVGVMIGLLFIIASFFIWFAMHLTISSLNFIAPKNGLMELLKSLSRMASMPPDIFSASIRTALFTIFPVAFIAAVPAKAISGVYSLQSAVTVVAITVISLLTAFVVWNTSIRSYTSAGG